MFLHAQKSYTTKRINTGISVDGLANETAWQVCEEATDFIQFTPRNMEASEVDTRVKIAYDDDAIYLFVTCLDDPKYVSTVLTARDDFNANTDNFQVTFDTYNDDLNGFNFGISSTGVQYDSKMFQGNETIEFNLVWQSKALVTDSGWQAELRIPYSALRFPHGAHQEWGVNFYRQRSFTREESCWNAIDPTFDNYIAQCGKLIGIEGIHPPLRLAFIPYLSGYQNFYSSDGKTHERAQQFNGGMDIKYGVNEAFTLDMTLIPDFGQVVFDNNVLNVSPFEIQFNENRQFFTEGTELFTKAGLFYSRRIGIQAPQEVLMHELKPNEQLGAYSSNSQLYNASKLSGRTNNGMGIGVFNAISAEQKGNAISMIDSTTREITLSPLTNYNVVVFDQNLKHNGYINLTNTNVTRKGSVYDANAAGLKLRFNSSDNKYGIEGYLARSYKMYTAHTAQGGTGYVTFGKQTGNYVYSYKMTLESDTYNPNDLGFNTNNNKHIHEVNLGYRNFEPTKHFIKQGTSINISYNRLFLPNVFTFLTMNTNSFFVNKHFNGFGINTNCSFVEGYDYFEPRTPGRFFIQPKWLEVGCWFSSNYQKRLALDLGFKPAITSVKNWYFINYSLSPRIRLTDRILMVISVDQNFVFNTQNYAVAFGTPAISSSSIVFGQRHENNLTNTINLNYTFNYKTTISFRLRHYRSVLNYSKFYDLQENGRLLENNMTGLNNQGKSVYDINYNAFTIDCVFRWVIQPGSELNLVWKNSLFQSDVYTNYSYLQNTRNLFDQIATNSFSAKLLVWIDYLSLQSKTRKR